MRVPKPTSVIDATKGKLRLRLPRIFARQHFGMDTKVFTLELLDTPSHRAIAEACRAMCDKDIALGTFDFTFQKYKRWIAEQIQVAAERSKVVSQEPPKSSSNAISYATKAITNLPWIIHGFLLGDSAEKLAESYELDLQTIEEIIRLSFDIKLHPLSYYLNKSGETKQAVGEEGL